MTNTNKPATFKVGEKVYGVNNQTIGVVAEVLALYGGQYYAVDFTGDGPDCAEICAEETLKPSPATPLAIDSQEIVAFLAAWVPPFGRKTRAVERRKYIALDYDNGPDSWSGCFLVDRVTHRIYTIKGYGVRGYDRGTVEEMTTQCARAHYEREAKAATRAHYQREARRATDSRDYEDCHSDADPGL